MLIIIDYTNQYNNGKIPALIYIIPIIIKYFGFKKKYRFNLQLIYAINKTPKKENPNMAIISSIFKCGVV